MQRLGRELEELMPIHVLWSAGAKIVVYRGPDYVKPDLGKPIIEVSHAELEQEFEPAEQEASSNGSPTEHRKEVGLAESHPA